MGNVRAGLRRRISPAVLQEGDDSKAETDLLERDGGILRHPVKSAAPLSGISRRVRYFVVGRANRRCYRDRGRTPKKNRVDLGACKPSCCARLHRHYGGAI